MLIFIYSCVYLCVPLFLYILIPSQAAVMDLVESDKQRGLAVPVWNTYEVLLRQSCPEVQLPNQPNEECCRRFRLSVLI